jgi:hypothetical protein
MTDFPRPIDPAFPPKQASTDSVHEKRASQGHISTSPRLRTCPPRARAADLSENPGFDLFFNRPDEEKRNIEVKGRAGTGEIEVTDNEWAKARNLRDRFWLYVAYDCALPNPRLVRVPDSFGNLLAKAKGSVLIGPKEILGAAEGTHA